MAKVGMGNCMKNKWVKKDGNKLISAVDQVDEEVQVLLQKIEANSTVSDEKAVNNLKNAS